MFDIYTDHNRSKQTVQDSESNLQKLLTRNLSLVVEQGHMRPSGSSTYVQNRIIIIHHFLHLMLHLAIP